MPAFLVQYELIDKAPIYPDVVSFLSTNAQGKSDVFFEVMQLALESYTALGFDVPKSKADIRNFLLYLRNSTIKNNAFSETNQIITKTIPANNSYSSNSMKKKNKKEQASNPETTSPASPQKKEEEKKKEVKAKPKSNSDFEMFDYSMTSKEVKTSSSAPQEKQLDEKDAKLKAMWCDDED